MARWSGLISLPFKYKGNLNDADQEMEKNIWMEQEQLMLRTFIYTEQCDKVKQEKDAPWAK